MAAYHAEYLTDLAKPSRVIQIPHQFAMGDNESHTFSVLVYDSDNPSCGLMDGTVSGIVVRPDGGSVTLIGEKGEAVENVTLPDGTTVQATRCTITTLQACFAYAGQITVVIRLVDDETITAVFMGRGPVVPSLTDTPVDPGELIEDITTLIATANQAAEDAEDALEQASAIVSYAEQTGQTDAQKLQARTNIGAGSAADVADLMSATADLTDCVQHNLVPYSCNGSATNQGITASQIGNEVTLTGTSDASSGQGGTKVLLTDHIQIWNAGTPPEDAAVFSIKLVSGHTYRLKATVVSGTRSAGEGAGKLRFYLYNRTTALIDFEFGTDSTSGEGTCVSSGDDVQIRMRVGRLMTVTSLVLRIELEDLTANGDTTVAPVDTATATAAYTEGSLVICNGTLYKATANIAIGDDIPTYASVTTIAAQLAALEARIAALEDT